ncbi:MAG TPA: NrfD/PsrC family molybdoenzyme membrane anchor subunit [Terriglobales bacterium]|nr:NrfD/PsrC family molybdoenzyme membrane anchor subunit [Terriglobales bacterium]
MEWGFLIILYLFLGGLSAGLFFASAVATFFNDADDRLKRIARWGALLAPWPVALGSTVLIFDLGNWYRFYKLFLHFRWVSPMSIGAWLLMLFTLVSLVYAYAWLLEKERQWLFSKLPRPFSFLQALNVDIDTYRRTLAAIGTPLAVGVGIYTGVLLGAVQSRPFWNTNLVAQLFLFSALSTGCAVLMLAFALSRKAVAVEELRMLYVLDIGLLTLEFFIVLPYLVHGQLSVEAVRDSLHLILGGPFTVVFWVFFLWFGLLLPLGIEIGEMMPALLYKSSLHARKWLVGATAVLILSGGFLLRYVFVFAGQMSAFK